ncbi:MULTISPECIES: histidine phosphatase family protein [Exiguobacterium]|uniref:histidine phosphatase family protein n=1 Tax=Exiguobacterium TaxID=33986 RepID=UPI0008779D19|nr:MULTISPECIES: histidine phosphatase family protein [Exiguobacterium]TCI34628.1 histidine phosphatase family protein [Exiguobacterium sp. SH4S7]TCI60702.1 histidine phosphatase family protein [Exiguobacterium sp. SH0S2]TCI75417.1 histidine phosphatase family protein [Exiguobacterium sp. SH0S1]
MTELCLVRHGQTDWNFQEIIQGREDIPLNALGHRQAEESAAFLSQENWDVIVASPLTRAIDTAHYIAEACGIGPGEIIQDERFIEREFGHASGKPVPGIYEAVQADDQERVPGLESEDEMRARVLEGMEHLVEVHKGKRIIVVCHSHAIKAALSAVDDTYTFRHAMRNACSNYIEHREDQFVVKAVNVADHITNEIVTK